MVSITISYAFCVNYNFFLLCTFSKKEKKTIMGTGSGQVCRRGVLDINEIKEIDTILLNVFFYSFATHSSSVECALARHLMHGLNRRFDSSFFAAVAVIIVVVVVFANWRWPRDCAYKWYDDWHSLFRLCKHNWEPNTHWHNGRTNGMILVSIIIIQRLPSQVNGNFPF